MNLLKAALYDPAVAVSKATSALLAMTALDTTNLRLAITVPAHGMVFFRLRCTLTGATTYPVILLGVMNGATVLGRVTPTDFPGTANAASQTVPCVAEFTVTGLTPGAMNVDAAYAVQVILAATNIKYGGPNTNAGANAWGGFLFEAWDPQPQTANSTLAVDASGRVTVGAIANGVIAAATFAANALDAVWSTAARVLTAGTNIVLAKGTGITGFNDLDAPGVRAAVGLAAANLDTQLSGISTKTTNLPSDPADESLIIAATDAIMSRLGAPAGLSVSADVAAVKSDTAAVKTKTDSLTFTVAGKLDVAVYLVNGVPILGDGSATPFHV